MSAGGISSPDLLEITDPRKGEIFRSVINEAKIKNKKGAAVYAYSPGEYRNMQLFVHENGMSGGALKGDDIVSLFSFKRGKEANSRATVSLLSHAITKGGRRADSFDTQLPYLYDQSGLRVVARVKWNEKYKPTGWDKEVFKKFNNGEPDVLYYAYDPNYFGKYKPGDGRLVDTAEEAERIQREAVARLNE
jgi:hypothetical protein